MHIEDRLQAYQDGYFALSQGVNFADNPFRNGGPRQGEGHEMWELWSLGYSHAENDQHVATSTVDAPPIAASRARGTKMTVRKIDWDRPKRRIRDGTRVEKYLRHTYGVYVLFEGAKNWQPYDFWGKLIRCNSTRLSDLENY